MPRLGVLLADEFTCRSKAPNIEVSSLVGREIDKPIISPCWLKSSTSPVGELDESSSVGLYCEQVEFALDCQPSHVKRLRSLSRASIGRKNDISSIRRPRWIGVVVFALRYLNDTRTRPNIDDEEMCSTIHNTDKGESFPVRTPRWMRSFPKKGKV